LDYIQVFFLRYSKFELNNSIGFKHLQDGHIQIDKHIGIEIILWNRIDTMILSIATLNITALGKTPFSITRNDMRHSACQCHISFIVMLIVIIIRVIKLSVIIIRVIMLSVIIIRVIMLSVIVMSVIMLSAIDSLWWISSYWMPLWWVSIYWSLWASLWWLYIYKYIYWVSKCWMYIYWVSKCWMSSCWMSECHYSEYHYAECRYAEHRDATFICDKQQCQLNSNSLFLLYKIWSICVIGVTFCVNSEKQMFLASIMWPQGFVCWMSKTVKTFPQKWCFQIFKIALFCQTESSYSMTNKWT
jgi:hypothetical protein